MTHPIDLYRITPEQAIQGTVEMWTDMKNALGETPTAKQRSTFKRDWLLERGYKYATRQGFNTLVSSNCFLCEYAEVQWFHACYRKTRCDYCPICWPDDCQPVIECKGNTLDYAHTPIPDILAYIQDEKNRR